MKFAVNHTNEVMGTCAMVYTPHTHDSHNTSSFIADGPCVDFKPLKIEDLDDHTKQKYGVQ